MEIICIVCPNGCHLTVEETGSGLKVTGNQCRRGETYGREEATDPRRMVTCVVRTDSAQWPCIPVKTAEPVPKEVIPRLLQKLYSLRVTLPARRGDAVIEDFEGKGIRVVFSRTLPFTVEKTP
jgi:CxxC motif-containing protein